LDFEDDACDGGGSGERDLAFAGVDFVTSETRFSYDTPTNRLAVTLLRVHTYPFAVADATRSTDYNRSCFRPHPCAEQWAEDLLMALLDEVDKHRSDIHTDSYTVTWRELLNQYRDGDLLINPDYQRLFRWDVDQQSQYIESLLLGIPTPPIFLAQNDDGKLEVLDGLQRLSTLLKFFANERPSKQPEPPSEDDLDSDVEQNDIALPTTLLAGRFLPSLEGAVSTNLPETLTRAIKYARVNVILIEKGSKRRARYEVFRRLNKFGSLLSDQEIRNCTARLLGAEFPDQLRKLGREPIIRNVLALSDELRRSMGVEEMILRLLAFNFSKKPLSHEIREFLDDFMEYAAEGHFKLTPPVVESVIQTFDLIHTAIPDGTAFRMKNQGFSTNLFDVVAAGVFHNLGKLTPDSVTKKHASLQNSPELRELIGAGSNTRRKLEGRLRLGREWFGA